MEYLKINDIDFSMYVNELTVGTAHNYSSQMNAAGDNLVDYINSKRSLKVGIIPIDAAAMAALQEVLDAFSVTVSFLNPKTNALEENVACIIPSNEVSYYTIRIDNVKYKAFTFQINEL